MAPAKGGEGLRLFSRGADGLISGQGAIKPLLIAPQQVLTAQMALTTIALTAAIKDVQAAVERVEDKVDLLRDLIDSQRVGEILGSNRALARRAEKVGYGGEISETDWNAIDADRSQGRTADRDASVVRSQATAVGRDEGNADLRSA